MIHKTFEVDGSPDIDVRIESGRVEVHRGSPGIVDVRVDTKTAGFIVEQRGNSILVSSDKTTSWLSRGSAYIVIQAPEGSDLRVGVASAQIQADLPLGKVELKTASGDIEVESAEILNVKTASGDLTVRRVERDLSFTSASGDMRVREFVGESLGASTASGDIYVEDTNANIDINSASGDARIKRMTGRNANFKAMSGTIDIGIPERSEVSLDVKLLSGRLNLPDPSQSQEEPERHVTIRAKLVSGDLNIQRVAG